MVGFLLSILIFPPISRHLNGSDLSNASFWLRVALGSAVVTVLGFAVYRAVVRLKWSPMGWTLFHSSSHKDQTFETRPTRWKLLIPPALSVSFGGSHRDILFAALLPYFFCPRKNTQEIEVCTGVFHQGPQMQSDSCASRVASLSMSCRLKRCGLIPVQFWKCQMDRTEEPKGCASIIFNISSLPSELFVCSFLQDPSLSNCRF